MLDKLPVIACIAGPWLAGVQESARLKYSLRVSVAVVSVDGKERHDWHSGLTA